MTQQPRTPASPERPRRPTLRDEHRNYTRNKIIEAALKVFEVKGYSGATVDDVVSEAGASRATFYVYFKNKDEVAHALFELMVPQSRDAFTELDRALAAGSWAEIREWVRGALAWWDANRGAVLALEQIVASGGFGHGGLDQVQSDAMPIYLDHWGHQRRDEARLRVYLLSTLITRAHRAWRMDGLFSGLDEDAVLDVLTQLWIAGLQLDRLYPDVEWDRSRRPSGAPERPESTSEVDGDHAQADPGAL